MYSQASLLLLFVTAALTAQVQSPNEFFPVPRGSQFTPHHQLVDYFQHVAENSPQVELEQYGTTNEGRPLLLAYVSSPENMRRLEQIRQTHLQRAGLAETDTPVADDIAVVWLSYSVHGNEAAGSEAAPEVLYSLLTRPEAGTWLENTVVLLDPSLNPDGYNRYTNWYRQMSNAVNNPDPEHRAHNEPWPGGRVNHYLFDLNRDWAWATQKETRHRLKKYRQWMPHIHADIHEQFYNNPYYFAPAAAPYHSAITKFQGDFQTEIGKNHAQYFDLNGWLYFTREVFDLLYPSYGDTYPTFNGAIGMTYEQGGHARGGRGILTQIGDTLTLRDRIDHHLTTSLSTVEIAARRADRLVENFGEYFRRARENPDVPYRSYVVGAANGPEKLHRLAALLERHGIQYGFARDAENIGGAFDYRTGKTNDVRLAPDDLVIPVAQPMGTLVNVLFEPQPFIADSLTYDITAWSLPMAHNLHAFATNRTIDYVVRPFPPAPNSAATATADPYAYLVEWNDLNDARFLGAALRAGLIVRKATEESTFGGKTYPRGTLLLTRADNRKKADYHPTVQRLARKHNQVLDYVETGFSERGRDLGSAAWTFVKPPEVLLLSGEKTSPNSFGHTWYYFEQDLGYPTTIVDADRMGSIDLDAYDVLVLPSGYYGLGASELEKLRDWTRDGGKIIALDRAVNSFVGAEGFSLVRGESDDADDSPTPEQLTQPYAGDERAGISNFNPGAVVRLQLDPTHPVAYGYSDVYHSVTTNNRPFQLQENADNIAYTPATPQVYGFVGSNLKKKMGHKVHLAAEDLGSGRVVYFIDNPLYRAFWEGGKLLVANAIFF